MLDQSIRSVRRRSIAIMVLAGSISSERPGFHDQHAQTFPLGGQKQIELETERIPIHPPHDGAVHTERPGMVCEVQGELKFHTLLNRRFRLDPATGRRDIMDLCFSSNTFCPDKAQMAIQVCPSGASRFGPFQLFSHPRPLSWSVGHRPSSTLPPVKKGSVHTADAHHPESVPRKRGTFSCARIGSSCIQAHGG